MPNLDFLIKQHSTKQKIAEKGYQTGIHELLEGEYCNGKSKKVFLHTTRVKKNNPSGFTLDIEMPVLSDMLYALDGWTGITATYTSSIDRMLFIDTETTGLSTGPGTYVFLVGLGYFRQDQFFIKQYFLTDPGGENEYVELLIDDIEKFDVLVSFNGKSYDIPLLDTRFILNSIQFPIRDMDHIDLLPLSRRIWRHKLPGCSLQQLETHVIQTGRQPSTDVPGYLIPQLYFDFLDTRDSRPLLNIFYHNQIDIISMVLLLCRISNILESPTQIGLESKANLPSIARWYHNSGQSQKAIDLYQYCIDEGIDALYCIRELSFIYKRSGQLKKAAALWEMAADRKEIYAHIELAKVAEHKKKNYAQAISLTEYALEIAFGSNIKDYRIISELQHRLQRIERKNAK